MGKVDVLVLESVKNLIQNIISDNENYSEIKAMRQYCAAHGLSANYGTCLKKMQVVVYDGDGGYILNPATEIDLFTGETNVEELAVRLMKYVKIYRMPKKKEERNKFYKWINQCLSIIKN